MKKEVVFGVVWFDLMVGTLTLKKANAAEAIAAAKGIIAKGVGKVEQVRAVMVTANDEIVDLEVN